MSTASSYERYLLKLINDYRIEQGLEPLTGNIVLNKVAEDHTRWQIDSRNLGSHINFDDPSLFFPEDRMKAGGYPDENSHFDETTMWSPIRRGGGNNPDVHKAMIEASFEQILNSPGHLASLRNPNAKEIGIGLEIDNITWPGGDPNDPRSNGPGIVITINYGGTTADTSDQADTPGPHPATGPSPTPKPEPEDPDSGKVHQGTDGNDLIEAGTGNDTLNGNAGNDTLSGGFGRDSLDGGAGKDYASYATSNGYVIVDLQSPNVNTGQAAGDTYTSIEGIIGSSYDDTIRGDQSANTLMGEAGNDRIEGKAGNDTLNGGSGNDSLFGGAQEDLLIGQNGSDELHGHGGFDTLKGGAGNDKLYGGHQADVLFGGSQEDLLMGQDGQDRLYGEGGFDTLDGGAGNDKLYGGHQADVLIGGIGFDTLNGGDGNDKLYGGNQADVLNGGGQNDRLLGQAGNDRLSGGGGFDTLNGGAGNDVMFGGGNADRFVFVGAFGQDRIADFDATNPHEKISLSSVASITDYNDLINNHVSVQGSDVIIDAGGGNTIRLTGVSLSDLDASDFLF